MESALVDHEVALQARPAAAAVVALARVVPAAVAHALPVEVQTKPSKLSARSKGKLFCIADFMYELNFANLTYHYQQVRLRVTCVS